MPTIRENKNKNSITHITTHEVLPFIAVCMIRQPLLLGSAYCYRLAIRGWWVFMFINPFVLIPWNHLSMTGWC